MSWLGKIDAASLRMNVNTQKRFQRIRFCDDVPIFLEIIFELLNEILVAGSNGEIVDVNTKDNDLCWRGSLEK